VQLPPQRAPSLFRRPPHARQLARSLELRYTGTTDNTFRPLHRMYVAVRYLVPCTCGRKVPVESRQAGQTVVCACGAALEVPTLLRLAALEQEESAAAAPSPVVAWGLGQAVALVGLVVLLVALAGAIYLCFDRPLLPTVDPQKIHEVVQSMPPAVAYRNWNKLRDQGLDPKDTAIVDVYNEAVLRYRLRWAAVLLAAIAGIAAIVVPLARTRKLNRVPRPSRPCGSFPLVPKLQLGNTLS
jgi:hypothetical protein